MKYTDVNPIIKADFPDPSVIRVEDTYYMLSTTMHFFPGGVLLRSYDLINWEIINHIFDILDDNANERLDFEDVNYGCGMWAPSLNYKNGRFFASFISHKTNRTFIYTTTDICGKWERRAVFDRCFYDGSLLLDDDGRNYIIYGNTNIYIQELNSDLSAIKEDGLNRLLVTDTSEFHLGYEGTHAMKINGKYYLFFIHWPKTGFERRTEDCFMSDSLEGEFKGREVFNDDMGFYNQGIAQGGLVDTPSGKWYAVLFRDNGAVGRIPVVVPVEFRDDFPVFGKNGKTVKNLDIASSRPYYHYEPIYSDDSLLHDGEGGNKPQLKKCWEFNHRPKDACWSMDSVKGYTITTDKICVNLTHARNTLTQRCAYPRSEAIVTVDASNIKEGDVAGLCILQGVYGLIGITKETGEYFLVNVVKPIEKHVKEKSPIDYFPGVLVDKVRIDGPVAKLCIKANFEELRDQADFFYEAGESFTKLGKTHNLLFTLDHFTGARFGLFMYSTKEFGGSASFKKFYFIVNG